MARQYTAWVIQMGRGKSPTFYGVRGTARAGQVIGWFQDAGEAFQFVRREDARNFMKVLMPYKKTAAPLRSSSASPPHNRG